MPKDPPLLRAVGLFSLTAISVNGMVGSGIFVLPAQVAGLLGPAALSAYLAAGLATTLIVLCFAEVAARFDRSGGPYLYAREAFGGFAGFEVGWMMLLARITSIGAITNAFASYLGFFAPALAAGPGRVVVISAVILALAVINYRGVTYGAGVAATLTVSKLVPLLVFVAAGVFALDPAGPSPWTAPQGGGLQQASLLLMFAFGGFEMAVVPGAEIIAPRRNIPIAMLSSIALVVALYILIQLVAQGTLQELASSATPLASSAARFLGPAGAALVTLGAVLSTCGTTSGVMLTGPRMIFAMGEGGHLPAIFGRVHPRFRTPHVAVLATAILGWLFAMFSQFATLAAVSALARLVAYMGVCVSLPVLRRKMPGGGFRVPAGTAVAIAATAISLWLVMGSTGAQMTMGGAALVLGAVIYAAYRGRS